MTAISDIAAGKWVEVLAVLIVGKGEEASAYAPCEIRLSRSRKGFDIGLQLDRQISLCATRSGSNGRLRFMTGDFEMICDQEVGNGTLIFASTVMMKPKRARRHARPR